MHADAPAGEVDDFPVTAAKALRAASKQLGLDYADARLIRVFGTAVYYLPGAAAVARIAQASTPEVITRLRTSVRVTHWLAEQGFPVVEPLPVVQPVASH